MNTKSYRHKFLIDIYYRIESVREMCILKFRVILAVIILSTIPFFASVIAPLSSYYTIHSSGQIVSPSIQPTGGTHSSEIRSVFFKLESLAVAPDWGLVCDTLVSYGINTFIVETMFTFAVCYPSQYVSQINYVLPDALEVAHAKGLKFYVHMNTLLGTAGPDYAAINSAGGGVGFTCPTKQIVRTRIKNLCEEVATNYDIDGFMIDYARYDNVDSCYCSECRAKFEAYLGEGAISDWTLFYPGGGRYNEFMEWRTHPMNELVRDMTGWLKGARPDIDVVGTVWGLYDPSNPWNWKWYLGQDWAYWVKEGYVDWVSGMAYTTDINIVSNCVITANQFCTGGPEGKVPYGSVLANAFPTGGPFPTPQNFNAQIEAQRAAGSDGWVIYSYGGPGENVGFAPDIRPYLNEMNLYPTFSIDNITASPTPNTCIITWTTTLPATSKVEFSTSPLFTATFKQVAMYPPFGYWDVDHVPGTVVEKTTPETNHSITLTGLSPGTKYYFRVQSQDSSGITTSKVYDFTP